MGLRYFVSDRTLTLGVVIALSAWPWSAGCGGATHSDTGNDAGKAGHLGGANASSGGAANASSGGQSSGGRASGGNASSLGGRSSTGGSTATSGGPSAGTSNEAGAAGSGGDRAISCTGATRYFPEFDRSCIKADDCTLVTHRRSCCGASLVMAISASAKQDFAAAEAICDAQYPACGCATRGIDIEDGTQVGASDQASAKATCDGGSCRAHYVGTTFTCGAHLCTDQQYCTTSSGGPAGTEPSSSCTETTCTDCTCLTIDAGCTCSASAGHLSVSCQRA